ncbi:ATP-binding protein [Solimonas marina]|uniref:Histidine kinase/HSP90-like ATPase domain-containing protein n=1 Tax=Solimonas marina TaxID=2714601 RepID=A0A969WDY6_9GAMM|nr:ATP-binding protein [Solimonas marina]NKF23025.1 hypothetical protein [Solimonas marina]
MQREAVGIPGVIGLLGLWLCGLAGASPAVFGSATIRAVTVGDHVYAAHSGLLLPPGTRSLRIDYELTDPLAHFAYRLDNVDPQWRIAGGRLQAAYTNLEPGSYRFRIAVTDADGSDPFEAARLDFRIAPRYFQTWWFRLACTIAALAALWLLYLLRLRQMTLRLRVRLEERYGERERIARELHDTLLQSIQGLLLRFEAFAADIRDPATRAQFERTLDRADAVLVEGRERVRLLREMALPAQELEEAYTQIADELALLRPVPFRVTPDREHRRPLNPLVRDELLQLGREALNNAFQHAQARHIDVLIAYGRKELELLIRDDGRGIDRAILAAGGRPGHWGLSNMRERADKIGATFVIRSESGVGTEVTVRVPAAAAYCNRSARRWLRELAGRAVAHDVLP